MSSFAYAPTQRHERTLSGHESLSVRRPALPANVISKTIYILDASPAAFSQKESRQRATSQVEWLRASGVAAGLLRTPRPFLPVGRIHGRDRRRLASGKRTR